jgi:pimeloyl-ACP methyl ester carboxylesterase
MFFFQLPGLPEAAFRARNFRALDETFAREIFSKDAFAHGEIDDYKTALGVPGALTAAINYYRAAFRRRLRELRPELKPIPLPTLLLWGDHDVHLGTSLTNGLDEWVPDLVVRHFPNAGHWVHLDEPDEVSRAMIDWFSRHAVR